MVADVQIPVPREDDTGGSTDGTTLEPDCSAPGKSGPALAMSVDSAASPWFSKSVKPPP